MTGKSGIQTWHAGWLGHQVDVDDRAEQDSNSPSWLVRGTLVGVNHHIAEDGSTVSTVSLRVADGQVVTVDVVIEQHTHVPQVH